MFHNSFNAARKTPVRGEVSAADVQPKDEGVRFGENLEFLLFRKSTIVRIRVYFTSCKTNERQN